MGARRAVVLAVGMIVLAVVGPAPAAAQHIRNGKAVFAALDKVTARISRLEIKLGDSVRFGALKVTPRACYSRPPTEPPDTATFVEIDEVQLEGKVQRLFSGWMFAESPGLNAVEHPVFDIWLTDCAAPASAPVAERPATGGGQTAGSEDGELTPPRRTRPRR